MAKINIEIVPTEGNSSNKKQSLPKTGASLKEVLRKSRVSTRNKDFFVSGEPAQLNTHVGVEDTVKVVERPQGS